MADLTGRFNRSRQEPCKGKSVSNQARMIASPRSWKIGLKPFSANQSDTNEEQGNSIPEVAGKAKIKGGKLPKVTVLLVKVSGLSLIHI